MSTGGRELIATDEPTVIPEPILDATIVEDRERDGSFADPACTDESDGFEVFRETDDFFDQSITSETSSRWRGRQLSEGNTM